MIHNPIQILLVEDNPDDVELSLYALKRYHVANQIHVARDGHEALDFLFCRGPYAERDINRPPGLILLDLKLPGIGGLEIVRQLKQESRTNSIPIVAMTSSNERRELIEGERLGVNHYFEKPIDFERFRELIHRLGFHWVIGNARPI